MAGGSGTRFWPRSKQAKPKQFLNLFGNESLLQSTVRRFQNFLETENIYIVSSLNQKQILEEQTPEIPQKNLIYEPVGKNTLPCIGLAAMFTQKENPDGIMIVSPSDHLIKNNEIFSETILEAVNLAENQNGIVTIGITPTYPATGYGFVKINNEITGNRKIRQFTVEQFVEKPDYETAVSYLEMGGFYWNSGMFVFKVSVILDAVKEFAPDLYYCLREIQTEMGKPGYEHTLDSIYRKVESISIDYGIMENAQNIYMVEGNFDWNDLGSWESVYKVSEKNESGNYSSSEAVFLDTSNSYVHAENGLVALVGLDDVVVVQDGNTTLVCHRERAEDVKKIVEYLKKTNKDQYL